jgi:hypothetical protein
LSRVIFIAAQRIVHQTCFSMNCNLRLLSSNFKNARFGWAAALLFIFPKILLAQVFEAKTEAKEVALGNTFEISFSLKEVLGEQFKAPDFKDFKVTDGPLEKRGGTIVKGKTSPHQSWTYQLEPRRTGTLTIGEARIVADGKTLNTQPLNIRVVPAKAKPNVNLPAGATDEIFIVGELDRTHAYLGQQVTWRVKLYNRVAAEPPDFVGWPDFHGFYSKEKKRFDVSVQTQTVRGKKYNVRTLHEEALFPQEVGKLIVGPAKVSVGVEQIGAVSIWQRFKNVILETLPVTLNVKALPAPAPEGFTNGVGQYDWQVETDRDSLTTDDALTLKLSLRGNGDSRRFAPPKLTLPAGLEVFEPKIAEEEEYENGEQVIHTKVFEYVILPKEPGEYNLPVSLVYFDPDTNRFRTLQADSLPLIRVTAGKNYRSESPIVDTLPLPPPVVLPPTDIWREITGWLQSPMLWSLLTLPLFLFGIFYLLKKQKKTPAVTAAATTNRLSAKAARERFAKAARLLNGGNPRAFYDELFKVLQGYLTARFGLTPGQMTQENIRKLLTERHIPSGTIQNLLAVWQTCEQALFAGQTQAAQMENTWRAAESVVQDLEKTYRR